MTKWTETRIGGESRQVKILLEEELALGDLLRLSLQSMELGDYLQQSLEALISSVYWLNLQHKGGIFLNQQEGKGEMLDLVAQYKLSPELHKLCKHIPFGHCLCGRAAKTGRIQFAQCVDSRHDVKFEGMQAHGHYNVPVLENNKVLAVLVLYLVHGHERVDTEVAFLQRVADVLSMGIQRRYTQHKLFTEKERHKQAMQQLSSITGNMPGIIFQRLDRPDGSEHYPFVSTSAEEILGYSAQQLLDGGIYSLTAIYAEDVDKYQAALAEAQQKLSTMDIEYRIVLNSGNVRWIHCRAKPHQQSDGCVVWDGIVLDIHERKELEGQLIQAQKLEAVGQLAAGIAHEINTPAQYVADNTHFLKEAFDDMMKIIKAYGRVVEAGAKGTLTDTLLAEAVATAEAADLEFIEEEGPKALEQAMEGLQKISIIVSAMKSFSHPGSDEMERVDINSLIQNTVTVSRNEWKYIARLNTDLEPDLPAINGFGNKLSQVFLNLIINAAHAIEGMGTEQPPDQHEISISTRHTGKEIEIRLCDTGPGVPEAIRTRVFDPFFTTKEVGKGTGQGLAITHSVVVDSHHGSLSLASGKHGGALFVIRLPIDQQSTGESVKP